MTITSIYGNHYLGETYRTGVAYLRARDPKDDRAPSRVGYETLDEQRMIIADAARAQQTIIVAEFIDYGDTRRGMRPGFRSLTTFATETHVPTVFVAHEHYLDWRRTEFRFLMSYLINCDLALDAVNED